MQHEHTHTHTCTHTHRLAQACLCVHARTHTPVIYQGNETEEKVFKKRRFKRADRGRMADRNRELVPDNWSLVREKALTTRLCSEAWYSEHLGVCRRAELPGRRVKVKKFWKVDGSLLRNDLKATAAAPGSKAPATTRAKVFSPTTAGNVLVFIHHTLCDAMGNFYQFCQGSYLLDMNISSNAQMLKLCHKQTHISIIFSYNVNPFSSQIGKINPYKK